MIAKMISEFAENSSPKGRFLTSFIPAKKDAEDYKGTRWVGKVLKTDKAGMIRHSLQWVRNECLAWPGVAPDHHPQEGPSCWPATTSGVADHASEGRNHHAVASASSAASTLLPMGV